MVLRIEPRAYGLVLASTEVNTQPGVCVLFITNAVLWIKGFDTVLASMPLA